MQKKIASKRYIEQYVPVHLQVVKIREIILLYDIEFYYKAKTTKKFLEENDIIY